MFTFRGTEKATGIVRFGLHICRYPDLDIIKNKNGEYEVNNIKYIGKYENPELLENEQLSFDI